MSVDELRALEQAAGEPLVDPFFEDEVWWWRFGWLEEDELALARALVVAWNALPGLLGRVAAAEAERDALRLALDEARVAWHDADGHYHPIETCGAAMCERWRALAASASGVAEPTTKETR